LQKKEGTPNQLPKRKIHLSRKAKEIPEDPETWLALSLLWQRTFKPFIAVPLTELTVRVNTSTVLQMVLLDELTLKSTTWGSLAQKSRIWIYKGQSNAGIEKALSRAAYM